MNNEFDLIKYRVADNGSQVVLFFATKGVPHHANLVKADEEISSIVDIPMLGILDLVAESSTEEKFLAELELTVPHDEHCMCKELVKTAIHSMKSPEKAKKFKEQIDITAASLALNERDIGVDGPTEFKGLN